MDFLMALLHGWYPHWRAVLRSFQPETIQLIGMLLVVAIANVSAVRKAGR